MAKKKIALFRPSYSNFIYDKVYEPSSDSDIDREIRPPLGLMALAGYLLKFGHDVRIIDGEPTMMTADESVDSCLAIKPDIVGITSTTPEYPFAREILTRIKNADPRIVTVMGGAHITNLPDYVIADMEDVIDWGVLYEGEKPFAAIANGDTSEYVWAGGKSEKLLLAKSRLDDDELSSFEPSRDVLDMSKYKYVDSESGLVKNDSLETARGCPFACSFCTSRKTSMSYRTPESIMNEIINSATRYDTRMFMFFDDTFTLSRSKATDLFTRIIWSKKKGLLPKDVRFYGSTRANAIWDMDFLLLLKEAGCDKITFGIETGSEKLLKYVEKGTVPDDYRRVYGMLDEVGILKRGSFIIGFPHETEATIRESIDFALELNLDEIGVNILTPYPGQLTLRQAIKAEGLWLRDDFHYKEFQVDGSEDWYINWSMYKRWGVSVVETQELSGEALEFFHGIFLQEVYGADQMARRREAQIRKGNNDKYWHRPWITHSKNKIEREKKEKLQGRNEFIAPKHLKYTYNPIKLTDYQKNELLFRGKGKRNFIPKQGANSKELHG